MKTIHVNLDKFTPRWYQKPIFKAIEKDGFKRVIVILPRRAGKDITCWNLMIYQALKVVGIYWYILPTYAQGKKVIFDGIDNKGMRFLDYIPAELRQSVNSQEMKIRLKNGSIIQVIGSDNVDTLVGSNPRGCVFSEYALTDPRAYPLIRPILTANDGWCIMVSTPRGHNHLKTLWDVAQEFPDKWFSYKMTVEDTKHIPIERINEEIRTGEMSKDLAQQEYYCSFDMGIEGAYYTRYLDDMKRNGQITQVPWQPAFQVNTAWDLGMRDQTSIIFYQNVGNQIHIIDAYENTDVGLEHYIKYLQSKPYIYNKHFAPHDIKVRELGTGMSRLEKARQLGIRFNVAPNLGIMDGIEAVRSTLPRVWVDKDKAVLVVRALENYRKEFDSKRKVYKQRPLHNEYSHMSDSLRYMCISLPKTKDGLSQEDMDKMKRDAHGGDHQFPEQLQQPTYGYH